jgi:hypothetical protein
VLLLNQITCNFSAQLVRGNSSKGLAVVGNGNIDVGNKTATRKAGQPIVEGLAGSAGSSEPRIPMKTKRRGICGAMSEQRGDSGRGNESAPQEFVRLVGYRDPKARAEPWVRPCANPIKRS